LLVTAHYSDGYEYILSNGDYTLSGGPLTSGVTKQGEGTYVLPVGTDWSVTVHIYDNLATAFSHTINGNEFETVALSGITVTPPTKTSYVVGEALNLAGMVVTANYTDGSNNWGFTSVTIGSTTISFISAGSSFNGTINWGPSRLEIRNCTWSNLNGTYNNN